MPLSLTPSGFFLQSHGWAIARTAGLWGAALHHFLPAPKVSILSASGTLLHTRSQWSWAVKGPISWPPRRTSQ